MQSKSRDWFLYDRDRLQERVNIGFSALIYSFHGKIEQIFVSIKIFRTLSIKSYSKVYLELSRTSAMQLFAKVVNVT